MVVVHPLTTIQEVQAQLAATTEGQVQQTRTMEQEVVVVQELREVTVCQIPLAATVATVLQTQLLAPLLPTEEVVEQGQQVVALLLVLAVQVVAVVVHTTLRVRRGQQTQEVVAVV